MIRWKPKPRPSGKPGGPWLRTALSGPDCALLEGVHLLGHRPAGHCPVDANTNEGGDRAPVRHPAVTENYRTTTIRRNQASRRNPTTVLPVTSDLHSERQQQLVPPTAVADSYPDLKASQNFAELQEELATTENRIAYSRQYYNDAVLTYSNAIQTVPANIVAGMGGFTAREYFQAPGEERGPVQVRF
ncbi:MULTISPECIES: LemA family protein [unclassified Nonomuraea]|uniref:LemA family protein n=1 Tax=unclassified Nonomuraea TaxID=2593643 RepID=UPI0033E42279